VVGGDDGEHRHHDGCRHDRVQVIDRLALLLD
jgi:hypothetical protein